MNAATTDVTALMKDSYTTAMRRAQDYAQKNTEAAFEFARELSTVRSPTEFLELSTSHSRKQFEASTEQARELATLAQKNGGGHGGACREGSDPVLYNTFSPRFTLGFLLLCA